MRHDLRNIVVTGLRTQLVADSHRDERKHVAVLSQLYPPRAHMFAPGCGCCGRRTGHQVTCGDRLSRIVPAASCTQGYRQRFQICRNH